MCVGYRQRNIVTSTVKPRDFERKSGRLEMGQKGDCLVSDEMWRRQVVRFGWGELPSAGNGEAARGVGPVLDWGCGD